MNSVRASLLALHAHSNPPCLERPWLSVNICWVNECRKEGRATAAGLEQKPINEVGEGGEKGEKLGASQIQSQAEPAVNPSLAVGQLGDLGENLCLSSLGPFHCH